MRSGLILLIASSAIGLAGCAGIPKEQTVAQYCSDADNAYENVCRLKVEIDGNATALADTEMRLGEARRIADSALRAAGSAQTSADRAQDTADRALSLASNAMLKEENLVCETRTIQKSAVGTCQPGYTVMGCSQTRYTHRSGGLSFLREVNNQQCRFNSQVLEMQVRCCTAAPTQRTLSSPDRRY